MAPNTIQTLGGFGRNVLRSIESELRDEFGVRAVYDNYYNPDSYSVSPLPLWWLGMVFLASIPVSLYSHATGQSTLPASNPFGLLMLIVMVGGLIVLTLAHFGMYVHGKYVNSSYKVRSPVVRE